jgi:hypothetical protein
MLLHPPCAFHREPQATTPDHKKEHHESHHFGLHHSISADFRSFSAQGGSRADDGQGLMEPWTLVSITLEQDGAATPGDKVKIRCLIFNDLQS